MNSIGGKVMRHKKLRMTITFISCVLLGGILGYKFGIKSDGFIIGSV